MTRYLLDTHALIWWWLEDPLLSAPARDTMTAADIWVSAVSLYEIANKVRRKRLAALRELLADHETTLASDGFRVLPLTPRHATHAGLMAGGHRDPFDRMIAGQALLEGMTVVTRDREIAGFGCEVLW